MTAYSAVPQYRQLGVHAPLALRVHASLRRLWPSTRLGPEGYAPIFKELSKNRPRHILFIHDIRPLTRRIGDTIVYYRPIILALLSLNPEADVTLVTDNPDLWNDRHPRLHILPKQTFLALYIQNDLVLAKERLSRLKLSLGIDCLVSMDKFSYPIFRQAAELVFNSCFFANGGSGVSLKIGTDKKNYQLLPWIPSFIRHRSLYEQSARFLASAGVSGTSDADLFFEPEREDDTWVKSIFKPTEDRSVVLINLFSKKRRKDWQSVRGVARLTLTLIRDERMAVAFPAPLDQDQRKIIDAVANLVPEEIRRFLVIAPDDGIRKLKLLIRKADYIVTVDTGVAHLAVAMNKNPIILYHRNYHNGAYYAFLPWMPSFSKRHRDYVTSLIPSLYPWKSVLKKILRQQARAGKPTVPPGVRIFGADDAVVVSDPSRDAVTITHRSLGGKMPVEFDHRQPDEVSGKADPTAIGWAYYRAERNNITYFDSSRASAGRFARASQNLIYVDSGCVTLYGVSGICVIKRGKEIGIYAGMDFERGREMVARLVRGKKMEYLKPPHLKARGEMPLPSKEEVASAISTFYGMQVSEAIPFTDGKVRGSVFKVRTIDEKSFVFRYAGKNWRHASILAYLAHRSEGLFPRPVSVTCVRAGEADGFLIRLDGHLYMLEEFVDGFHPSRDRTYFHSLGRAMGKFHNHLDRIRDDLMFEGVCLPRYVFNTDTAFLFESLFDAVSSVDTGDSPAAIALREHSSFINEKIEELRKTEFEALFNGLPRQAVHRDLSYSNVFFSNPDEIRAIDLESVCAAPRAIDFVHALIGMGAGQSLSYISGSMEDLIRAYGETAYAPLEPEEITLIRLLVRSRFIRQLVVDLIKNPSDDANHIARMISSFRGFCDEQPLDSGRKKADGIGGNVMRPARIPFVMPQRLEIFNRRLPGLRPENPGYRECIRKSLDRNMYCMNMSVFEKENTLDAMTGLSQLVPFIFQYFHTHHPTLKIVNISLFGSYAYNKGEGIDARDVDFLVIVKGNHFGLDEIPIDLEKYGLSSVVRRSVRSLSFSIKGEDNFTKWEIDTASRVSSEMQRLILHRTAAALYNRHIVLWGLQFADSSALLKDNSLAEASDLLINSYLRLFGAHLYKSEIGYSRIRKSLSRLYEASLYLSLFSSCAEASPRDAYALRVSFERGSATMSDARNAWSRTKSLIEARHASNKRRVLAFDYEGTLAPRSSRMSQEMLETLARELAGGSWISIVTARRYGWFRRNKIDVAGDIADFLARVHRLPYTDICAAMRRLSVFSAKASERHDFVYSDKGVRECLDPGYSRAFDQKDLKNIRTAVYETLKFRSVEGNLRFRWFSSYKGSARGSVNVTARFKPDFPLTNTGKGLRDEICAAIQAKIGLLGVNGNPTVMWKGSSIGVTPLNKGYAIRYLKESLNPCDIIYFGDDPEGGDSHAFSCEGEGVRCHVVNGPEDTLRILRSDCGFRRPGIG